jgi:hypothetical protein
MKLFKKFAKAKAFQSDIDWFFHEFDIGRKTLPKSRLDAQQYYAKLFHQRDHPTVTPDDSLWSEF